MMATSSRFIEPVSDSLEEEMQQTNAVPDKTKQTNAVPDKTKQANAVPDKTKAVTVWGISIYSEWASQRTTKASSVAGIRNLETPLLTMNNEELAYWLGKLILEIRKKNGYETKTLYQIVCCFKRHFEAK